MRTPLRIALLLVWAWAGSAQVAKEANKQYQTPEDRAGIAKTLEDSHRRERLKGLVALLDIRPGSTVADVGTGTGAMLEDLRAAVGPSGRVIAEDIQQDFLSKAEAKIKSNNWSNVTPVLGTERNPNLPEGQLDLVFILDAYHHFDYPGEMLGHISQALKPDGRLAIADFYRTKRGPQDKDMKGHIRADKEEVIKEIESNNYHLISQQDHGSNQYLLLFGKK